MSEESRPDFATDGEELDARERFVLLEERIRLVALIAIAAEVGVLALAVVIAINAWKARR